MLEYNSKEYRRAALAINYDLEALFNKNLSFFSSADQSIHKLFKQYSPSKLVLHLDSQGYLNLYNKNTGQAVYPCDPAEYAKQQVTQFLRERPNYLLSVNLPANNRNDHPYNKLTTQLHAKYLSLRPNKYFEAQDNVEQLYMFGGGLFLQFQDILNALDVKRLTVFESDLDAFYASMHIVDWSEIYRYFDRENYSLELILATDDDNIYSDIYKRILTIGVHRFAKIDLYFHYQNKELNFLSDNILNYITASIAGMGFFEDERVGLAQTLKNLESNIPISRRDLSEITELEQLPVLLIGNGPSLDMLEGFIKENRENFILVSCGTSLGTLEKKGIKPDIHLEQERILAVRNILIETTSQTFRKGIRLVALNPCHPKVFELFDERYMAIKDQDIGAVYLKRLDLGNVHSLKYPNPLVSNFGLSLLISLGFKNIYLAGIDCGMVTDTTHHSKDSYYYKDEKLNPYPHLLQSLLKVKGNFRDAVFTTDLFNKSRLGLALSLANADVNCFNLSDGAFIDGAEPCVVEELTAFATIKDKEKVLSSRLNLMFPDEKVEKIAIEDKLVSLTDDFLLLIEQLLPYFNLSGVSLEDMSKGFDVVEIMLKRLVEDEMELYLLINGSIRGLMLNLVAAKRALPPKSYDLFYFEIKPKIDLFFIEIQQQMRSNILNYDESDI